MAGVDATRRSTPWSTSAFLWPRGFRGLAASLLLSKQTPATRPRNLPTLRPENCETAGIRATIFGRGCDRVTRGFRVSAVPAAVCF
jgi:hypothetical protein